MEISKEMNNGKLKVLLISFSDNADHQECLYSLFEEMNKDTNTGVEVYSLGIVNPKFKSTFHKNMKFINCPNRPGIKLQTFYIWRLMKIINFIIREKFDVLYFESLHVWNIPLLFKWHKYQTYHVLHDVIPHEGDKNEKILKIMNKIIIKLSDHVILRNAMYKKYLIDSYNIEETKVHTIPLWRKWNDSFLMNDEEKILFFGRINEYKGIDNLLEIINRNDSYKYEIIGKVDDNPVIEEKIKKLKNFSNVELITRYVSEAEMKSYFEKACCVILPYKTATQSGVIIDSYKYGRPVIAFDVGAISEQINDNKTGYLIESGNIEMFSEKINFYMKLDDEKKNELKNNAFQYGKKKYAAERGQRDIIDLFSENSDFNFKNIVEEKL